MKLNRTILAVGSFGVNSFDYVGYIYFIDTIGLLLQAKAEAINKHIR